MDTRRKESFWDWEDGIGGGRRGAATAASAEFQKPGSMYILGQTPEDGRGGGVIYEKLRTVSRASFGKLVL